jgi:hypothetical protein
MRKFNRNYKTPTTAIDMFDMANEFINIMICPLSDTHTEVRRYKIEQALDQLPDKYSKIINTYIDRKMNAYYEVNDDGFSAYDMDQAILRGA